VGLTPPPILPRPPTPTIALRALCRASRANSPSPFPFERRPRRLSAIRQAQLTNTDVATVLAKYLLVYRNTPHATTGESPSMPLMGRRLRTRLGLLTPSVEKHVESRQYSTMVSRTAKRGLRQFRMPVILSWPAIMGGERNGRVG